MQPGWGHQEAEGRKLWGGGMAATSLARVEEPYTNFHTREIGLHGIKANTDFVESFVLIFFVKC